MVRPRVHEPINSTRTGTRVVPTASGRSNEATAPASPMVAVSLSKRRHMKSMSPPANAPTGVPACRSRAASARETTGAAAADPIVVIRPSVQRVVPTADPIVVIRPSVQRVVPTHTLTGIAAVDHVVASAAHDVGARVGCCTAAEDRHRHHTHDCCLLDDLHVLPHLLSE